MAKGEFHSSEECRTGINNEILVSLVKKMSQRNISLVLSCFAVVGREAPHATWGKIATWESIRKNIVMS